MNDYDCGVYVLWDIYCLTHHGDLRSISSSELRAQWEVFYMRLLSLDPYVGTRLKIAAPTSVEQIVISDSD